MLLPFQEHQKAVISNLKWPQFIGAFFLFFFSFTAFAKNVIVFVPGLNFNVEKFSEVEKALGEGYSYEYFHINYNQGTISDWQKKRDEFLKTLNKEKTSYYLIAQSLGALLFAEKSSHFEKTLYLSPAFVIRFAPKIICKLANIPIWRDLKSRNYKEYRLNDVTTRSAYKGLCELNSRFNFSLIDQKKSLIALDMKDELVDAEKIRKNVSNLHILKKAKDNKFHHLVVDEKTMGKGEFQRFIHVLRILFAP